MQTKVQTFKFSIPEKDVDEKVLQADGVVKGQKLDKSFEYKVCDNESEAQAIMTEKEWSLVGMVNDNLKANARSNAYQSALARYKVTDVKPEDIKERMIRDYVRLGISEEIARKQVDALLGTV